MATTPNDRLLTTVLGLFRDIHDEAKTSQILGTTASLLTTLANPLNVSLLTSHLLTAPAVWRRPSPAAGQLAICLRVMSIASSAAARVHINDLERLPRPGGFAPRTLPQLRTHDWARAVARGCDARSSRWQHLLVLVGLLTGLERAATTGAGNGTGAAAAANTTTTTTTTNNNNNGPFSGALRQSIEEAIVRAANLGLAEARGMANPARTALAEAAVTLALAYAFPLLSDHVKFGLDCDALAPAALRAVLRHPEGIHDGAFLGAAGAHVAVVDAAAGTLDWPRASPSFAAFERLAAQPLVTALGPVSRIVAYAVGHGRLPDVALQVQADLLEFSGRLLGHWRANRLSEVGDDDEQARLAPQTRQHTWPALLKMQRNIMYACVAVLQAVVARALVDRRVAVRGDVVAARALHVLRNLCFVSSRPGNSSFEVYTFAYMAPIDMLTRHPAACAALLREMLPPSSATGLIPAHALDRTLDLFYLALAEHLPLALSPDLCDALIVAPARVYLDAPVEQFSAATVTTTATATATAGTAATPKPPPRIVELFESAHSAILSVLLCPQNGALAARLAGPYADTLLSSFPSRISARQFRVAFKTLVKTLLPPFPISAAHPDLAETLLEMVRLRAAHAAASYPAPLLAGDPAGGEQDPLAVTSEQGALVLTLVDTLPFLPLGIFEEWLVVAGQSLAGIADPATRAAVRKRFCEVLSSGEMDVQRAAVAAGWWGTRGGMQIVLYGGEPPRGDQFMMSGAIAEQPMNSKL